MMMYRPLFLHTQEVNNLVLKKLEKDKELNDYYKIIDRTVFRTSVWTYLQALLFVNFGIKKFQSEIAVGSELILKSIYLKDDILDNTKSRNKSNTLAAEIGLGKANLLADILFSKGLKLILENIEKLSNAKIANIVLMNIVNGVQTSAKGQILGCLQYITDYNVERTLRTIKLKTCSIIEPLLNIPAFIYDKKSISLINQFSSNIGMAFQIHNDIEDYIGSDSYIGKPILEDLRSRQANIVTSFYLESVNYNNENVIVKKWDNKKISFNRKEKRELLRLVNQEAMVNSYNLYIDYFYNAVESVNGFNDNNKTDFANLLIYFSGKK